MIGAAGETFLRATRAAAACGVSRLADLTGLDRLGVPVYQAVRPWSRALSVHQGKGLTVEAARLGALMEAVESDHAERFEAPAVRATFEALPLDQRAPALGDFTASGEAPPPDTASLAWVEGRRLVDDTPIWLPFDIVSLDFTRRGETWLDRSSNGLAAHFDAEEAALKGLLEVVERDAVAQWRALPIAARSRTRVDDQSISAAWFQELRDRLDRSGLTMAVCRLVSVAALPAFFCEIREPGAAADSRAAVYGSACDLSVDRALRGAVLEAIQSRLTAISGARDDILPEPGAPSGAAFGLTLPLPPGVTGLDWAQISAGPAVARTATARGLAQVLAAAGYPDACVVDLSRPDLDVCVVKAAAPGLGAFGRPRRPVMAALA